jgi:excisionase family DNA binding protein
MDIEKRIMDIDKLPLTLNVGEVAAILGIAKAKAYELSHNKNFPSVQVGKRIIIPRPAFQKWMENPIL